MGAAKSLAQPGLKQATFPALYGTQRFITTSTTVNHLSLPQPNPFIPLPITVLTGPACFLPGRANDLSAPLWRTKRNEFIKGKIYSITVTFSFCRIIRQNLAVCQKHLPFVLRVKRYNWVRGKSVFYNFTIYPFLENEECWVFMKVDIIPLTPFLPFMNKNIYIKVKVKVKRFRYRPGVAQRVGKGIALLFHDRGTRRGWVVSSTPRPHFTSGKDPVTILQEAGWAAGPVWTGAENRSRTVQPVVSRYTDWATGPSWIRT